MVLGMGRKEVPVQDPEPKLQSFESTNDLVSMTVRSFTASHIPCACGGSLPEANDMNRWRGSRMPVFSVL